MLLIAWVSAVSAFARTTFASGALVRERVASLVRERVASAMLATLDSELDELGLDCKEKKLKVAEWRTTGEAEGK